MVECRLVTPARRQALRHAIKATVQKVASVECEVVLATPRSLTFTTSGKLSRAAAKANYLDGTIQDEHHFGDGRRAAVWRSTQSRADPDVTARRDAAAAAESRMTKRGRRHRWHRLHRPGDHWQLIRRVAGSGLSPAQRPRLSSKPVWRWSLARSRTRRLCSSWSRARAVVHWAGVVADRAPERIGWSTCSGRQGSQLRRPRATPPRFLLISSASRARTDLSHLCREQTLGEDAVRRGAGRGTDLCVLRPPAVYGPGDRATLPIFRQLRQGLLVVPEWRTRDFRCSMWPISRSWSCGCWRSPWGGCTLEPDDGRESGYRWQDLADIAGRHLGRRVRTIAVPRQVLWPAARAEAAE